jgi:hypothetical protein
VVEAVLDNLFALLLEKAVFTRVGVSRTVNLTDSLVSPNPQITPIRIFYNPQSSARLKIELL